MRSCIRPTRRKHRYILSQSFRRLLWRMNLTQYRWIFLRILTLLALVLAAASVKTEDRRCSEITKIQKVSTNSCGVLNRTDDLPPSCEVDRCKSGECCWLESKCYHRPTKCFVDLRREKCLGNRNAWGIYEGYSINGTYCLVETINSYFETRTHIFGDSVSIHGFKIWNRDEWKNSCSVWTKTNVTDTGDGTCQVLVPEWGPAKKGKIWAKNCVIEQGGFHYPFELERLKLCTCKIDAWLEERNEELEVSESIRDYVKREENRTMCTQILGRLVRASWKERLAIVNSAEAGVVVNALLNITNQTRSMTDNDARIVLDTSEQLSTYKFYERLENESAELLIQSATTVLGNIMKKVSVEDDSSRPVERSVLGPADLNNLIPSQQPLAEDLQWRIIQNLEHIAENVASQIEVAKDDYKYIVKAAEDTVNLQVAIATSSHASSLADFQHYGTAQQNAEVTDSTSFTLDEKNETTMVLITVFYNTSASVNTSIQRASNLLAVNLRGMNRGTVVSNISTPVRFSMMRQKYDCIGETDSSDQRCEPTCAFIHEENGKKTWSQYGCDVQSSEENYTTCTCNHTTHFAVLMMWKSTLTTYDTRILEILTIVLGSISIAALSSTCLFFIYFRKLLLKDRMLIHFQLIIALLFGYVFFLFGSVFSRHNLDVQAGCFVTAIASHFFFLSSFFWALIEGIYLFYKVVLVFSNRWVEHGAKYAPVLGWVIPAVIVVISIIVSRTTLWNMDNEYDPYYGSETCFLQMKNNMIWAFMGPVVAIIAINTAVLTKVMSVIFRSSMTSSKTSKTPEGQKLTSSLKNSAKGAVILMPILGIPWIVNMIVNQGNDPKVGYNYSATLAAYIHVILTGLQGVEILIFYCIFNSEVRNAYKLNSDRRKSMASLTTASNGKNRKRSRIPLLMAKDDSPERRKSSNLQVNITYKTSTVDTPVSTPPASPNLRLNLSPINENR